MYQYSLKSTSTEDPVVVLGHLSMLLDVQMSPCNKFILTSDRDEKIRISCYPNAYNIHNFCLGHSDFVSGICVLSGQEIVSCSGDGTVKLWRFLEGTLLDSLDCVQDLKEGQVQKADDDKSAVAVKAMKCLAGNQKYLLAVLVDG